MLTELKLETVGRQKLHDTDTNASEHEKWHLKWLHHLLVLIQY